MLNSCDEQGNVPLHWAVEKNRAESCRSLLDLGADPNVLNNALMSPLHLAVSLEHNHLVEVRRHSALVFLSPSIPQPPLDAANDKFISEAADLLRCLNEPAV